MAADVPDICVYARWGMAFTKSADVAVLAEARFAEASGVVAGGSARTAE